MTCKERILSNDYADVIIDYRLPEGTLNRWNIDFCFQPFDEEFSIAYLERAELPPVSLGTYTYASIPDLYGLMQTFQADNLVETGNLRVQGPPLELQGDGVIIGFVDTGLCVK